ncbi:hypothetical protein ABZ871_38250 [Streptomyces populi]
MTSTNSSKPSARSRRPLPGSAHGIVAIARTALTTDNNAYTELLERLHHRGVFLPLLPAVNNTAH